MTNIFKGYGIVSSGILNVSPREAFKLVRKGALIIDVREENLRSFKSFDVPELIYLPKSKLAGEYENLPMNSYMIFADTVGLRSKEAVIFMRERGFKKIANLAGGIVDWERDGLPITTDIANRLSGSCMCQLKPREVKKIFKI
jgi:rhodanese-related sulfurtransferase